jgi:hypothetical protein
MSFQDEDSIKAELRELTAHARKLREELRGLASSSGKNSVRSLRHALGLPKAPTGSGRSEVQERRRKPRGKGQTR